MSVDNTPEWYTKARKSQHPTPERDAAGGRDEEIESASPLSLERPGGRGGTAPQSLEGPWGVSELKGLDP